MQVGIANKSTISARLRSTIGRKAIVRLEFVSNEDSAMIGTTGSAPTIGTSTSGISAPVP